VFSKNSKSRIALLVHLIGGFFTDGSRASKGAAGNSPDPVLALPEMRPTLFKKIAGGGFQINETQPNPES